jgi:hypothetical protein
MNRPPTVAKSMYQKISRNLVPAEMQEKQLNGQAVPETYKVFFHLLEYWLALM